MALLPVRLYGDPVLRKKASAVEEVGEGLRALAADMIETMQENDGIGLAANQVGDLRRIIVVNFDIESGGEGSSALVNPEITERQGSMISMEGGLSIPDVWDEVERSAEVTVEYLNLDGERARTRAGGRQGAVVQHEINHLDGILFVDHIPTVRRMMFKGQLKQIARTAKQTA